MRVVSTVVALGLCSSTLVVACGSSSVPSAPLPDAGAPDAGALEAGVVDGGVDAGSGLEACPDLTGGTGTVHTGDITTAETWTASGSPHRITNNLRLLATLTIEECATVLLDAGLTITVGSKGLPTAKLVAKGRRGLDRAGAPLRRPVTFAAADPTKPWGSLHVDATSQVDFESVVLRDGATPESDQNSGGVLVAYGPDNVTTVNKNLRVVDVEIENARGYGINLLRYEGFSDDSKDLTIRNSGRADRPASIVVAPGAVGTIPSGFSASGNFAAIEIAASSQDSPTDRIKAFGTPYLVSGRLRVGPPVDGSPATLTIEPGVTLRFAETSDSGLLIGTSSMRQGILVATGTAAAPITFTSAKSPAAAGDWRHIYFNYSPATGNRIEHAVIAYAGAFSGAQGYGCGPAENDASVLLLAGRPSGAFIQHTRFENGAGDTGILLGWVSDADGPDFVATNTFVGMPACRVSRWRNATGPACPGSGVDPIVCF
jgi:hypothetical protein